MTALLLLALGAGPAVARLDAKGSPLPDGAFARLRAEFLLYRDCVQLQVLYEDDVLLFVNKPPNVVVQRGFDPEEICLLDVAEDYTTPVFLMQRLDRGTFDLFVLYSREWQPSWSPLRLPAVNRFWTRFFGREPPVPGEEIERRLDLRRIAAWTRRGQWIEVYGRNGS